MLALSCEMAPISVLVIYQTRFPMPLIGADMDFAKKTHARTKTWRKILSKNSTALDRKHEYLRKADEQLRKQKEQLELFLQKAPGLREERARRFRESLPTDTTPSGVGLRDKYAFNVSVLANPDFGKRPLRRERKKGLNCFLFLLTVLASVVFWICRLVP